MNGTLHKMSFYYLLTVKLSVAHWISYLWMLSSGSSGPEAVFQNQKSFSNCGTKLRVSNFNQTFINTLSGHSSSSTQMAPRMTLPQTLAGKHLFCFPSMYATRTEQFGIIVSTEPKKKLSRKSRQPMAIHGYPN